MMPRKAAGSAKENSSDSSSRSRTYTMAIEIPRACLVKKRFCVRLNSDSNLLHGAYSRKASPKPKTKGLMISISLDTKLQIAEKLSKVLYTTISATAKINAVTQVAMPFICFMETPHPFTCSPYRRLRRKRAALRPEADGEPDAFSAASSGSL